METISMPTPPAPAAGSNSNAEMMKSISKARLSRKAMIDPSFARELVKLESTGVYNAKGDVVQSASTSFGST